MRVFFHNQEKKIIGFMANIDVIPSVGDHVQVTYNFDEGMHDVLMLEPENSEHFAKVTARYFNVKDNEVIVELYHQDMRKYDNNMRVVV